METDLDYQSYCKTDSSDDDYDMVENCDIIPSDCCESSRNEEDTGDVPELESMPNDIMPGLEKIPFIPKSIIFTDLSDVPDEPF